MWGHPASPAPRELEGNDRCRIHQARIRDGEGVEAGIIVAGMIAHFASGHTRVRSRTFRAESHTQIRSEAPGKIHAARQRSGPLAVQQGLRRVSPRPYLLGARFRR